MRLDALMTVAALTIGGLVAPAAAQPAEPAAQPAATAPSADPFPPGWTGRPESAADAQREARAAASEALRGCRRQSGGDTERCLSATRRDNAAAIRRAGRPSGAQQRSNRPRQPAWRG